jgi:shikimate 5-dehydrogenase
VPFKQRATVFADEILPTGLQVGAINATRRGSDGRWKPDVTPLMDDAAKAGCRTGGGRLMVAGQVDAVLDFLGFGS